MSLLDEHSFGVWYRIGLISAPGEHTQSLDLGFWVLGLLGATADSRCKAGKAQGEPAKLIYQQGIAASEIKEGCVHLQWGLQDLQRAQDLAWQSAFQIWGPIWESQRGMIVTVCNIPGKKSTSP